MRRTHSKSSEGIREKGILSACWGRAGESCQIYRSLPTHSLSSREPLFTYLLSSAPVLFNVFVCAPATMTLLFYKSYILIHIYKLNKLQ